MDFSNPAEASRERVETAIKWWRNKRAERLEAEKVAKNIKKEEDELKSFVLEAFKQQKFEGMMIGERITGLATRSVPVVSDKEALMKYILSTGELDLLTFSLSTSAVNERTENDVKVPGTDYVDVYDLFDRKV